jgi:hypothetical protein
VTPTQGLPRTWSYFGDLHDHRALLAGMTFLEMTLGGQGDLGELRRWLDEHVVSGRFLAPLDAVREPQAGSVRLDPPSRPGVDLAPAVLRMARARVVHELGGLAGSQRDDRFIRAAIHAGRVRREGAVWRPSPTAADALSDIVLCLFAAAVLSEPQAYQQRFCLCDTCGRVSFDDRPEMRHSCGDHPPE